MNSWVLLLHNLPDSSWHYDWLIDRVAVDHAASRDADGRDLFAFRVPARQTDVPPMLDAAAPTLSAIRLADHRRLYLDYEGPLTNNRGSVRRAVSGLCTWSQPRPGQLDIHIDPASSGASGPTVHWHGRALGPQDPSSAESSWVFTLQT